MPCNQRNHCADCMRRLCGHVHREVVIHLAVIGHTTAGFDTGYVDSRDMHLFLYNNISRFEQGICFFLIACFPVPDMVVSFTFFIRTQYRCRWIKCFEWVNHRLHRFVFYDYRFTAIPGCILGGSNNCCHFLRLIHHGICRQYHLGIAHQGGHPVEVVFLQIATCYHGNYTGHLHGFLYIDFLYFGVCIRTPYDIHIEHAGQFYVVYVIAFTLNETGVLLAFEGVSHSSDGFRRFTLNHVDDFKS